ncbi:hypothetical protein IFM89_006188 [Coptis chinensis]|uniref:Pentatricopeptide repeat-containing protein n=1 Tax=Coptis chinensis TaxID=261450 RepID=A0A835HCU5_9MAGN|nr:hypothetical protein IFM89_006188 [Coptis chinensis]
MSARNLYSWNNMLSGYAKLGNILRCRKLFDEMPERDVVSWNTMVIMFAKNGFCNEALGFYNKFRSLCIGVNEYSFSGVLIACVKLEEFRVTQQVHGQVFRFGYLSNLVISSSIVDAYAKSGVIGDGKKMFDEMPDRDVLAWTTLVSGYAKVGDMEMARRLFDEIPEPNPVSWTSLISGYVRSGLGPEALKLFSEMMIRGIRPDQFTFSSCLCACASIASLKHGKQIHSYLIRRVFKPNAIVVSSLIDMYSKCGSLGVGRSVFDQMDDKLDIVLWNTMLSTLAQHGLGDECIHLFHHMQRLGTKPNRITLVVILNACSHSGLVDEGIQLFESMTQVHGITADQEHYACLVDLFGRAGRFDEVKDLLQKMSCKPDGRVWNAILGACKIHGNTELGRIAAEHLIDLEPQSSAAYVLLSNIYALSGRWKSVEKVRHLMNRRQVKKEQAISWVEVESKVHSFTVFDQLHPLKDEIYLALEQLTGQMDDDDTFLNAMESLNGAIIVPELQYGNSMGI